MSRYAPHAVRPEHEALQADVADGTRSVPSQIECVLLRDDKGHCSICISTQVGCAMKCAFVPRAWAA